MVEKRGSVGETTFHVCFLMQTPTHLVLARRLLKHYPKLINDVYLSEEYYGKWAIISDCFGKGSGIKTRQKKACECFLINRSN